MRSLQVGKYRTEMAADDAAISQALALRARCFRPDAHDADADRDHWDATCRHLLVRDAQSGRLMACCRLLVLPNGIEISRSYAARFYDLSGLAGFDAGMAELGRFCIDPKVFDPDILRIAWAGLLQIVESESIRLLFGCSSFSGVDPTPYHKVFALLAARYGAPRDWMPGRQAAQVVAFSADPALSRSDISGALRAMPPLLRTYLAMGGWVSDHAVVDRDLDTLHVFTGLETAKVPPRRVRSLRELHGDAGKIW